MVCCPSTGTLGVGASGWRAAPARSIAHSPAASRPAVQTRRARRPDSHHVTVAQAVAERTPPNARPLTAEALRYLPAGALQRRLASRLAIWRHASPRAPIRSPARGARSRGSWIEAAAAALSPLARLRLAHPRARTSAREAARRYEIPSERASGSARAIEPSISRPMPSWRIRAPWLSRDPGAARSDERCCSKVGHRRRHLLVVLPKTARCCSPGDGATVCAEVQAFTARLEPKNPSRRRSRRAAPSPPPIVAGTGDVASSRLTRHVFVLPDGALQRPCVQASS